MKTQVWADGNFVVRVVVGSKGGTIFSWAEPVVDPVAIIIGSGSFTGGVWIIGFEGVVHPQLTRKNVRMNKRKKRDCIG